MSRMKTRPFRFHSQYVKNEDATLPLSKNEDATLPLSLPLSDKLGIQVAIAVFIGHANRALLITDWYSAVGMFLREASSWVRVSTVLEFLFFFRGIIQSSVDCSCSVPVQ